MLAVLVLTHNSVYILQSTVLVVPLLTSPRVASVKRHTALSTVLVVPYQNPNCGEKNNRKGEDFPLPLETSNRCASVKRVDSIRLLPALSATGNTTVRMVLRVLSLRALYCTTTVLLR